LLWFFCFLFPFSGFRSFRGLFSFSFVFLFFVFPPQNTRVFCRPPLWPPPFPPKKGGEGVTRRREEERDAERRGKGKKRKGQKKNWKEIATGGRGPVCPPTLLSLVHYPVTEKFLLKAREQGVERERMFPRPRCPVSWVRLRGCDKIVRTIFPPPHHESHRSSREGETAAPRGGRLPHTNKLCGYRSGHKFSPLGPAFSCPPGGTKLHGGPDLRFFGLRTRPFLPLVVYVRGPYEPATHGVKGCADHGQRGHAPL